MTTTRKEKDKEMILQDAAKSFTSPVLLVDKFWGFKGARFTSWKRATSYVQHLLDVLEQDGQLEKEEEPFLLEGKARYFRV